MQLKRPNLSLKCYKQDFHDLHESPSIQNQILFVLFALSFASE